MDYQITKRHTVTLPDTFVKQYEKDFCELDNRYLYIYTAAEFEAANETDLAAKLDLYTDEKIGERMLEVLKEEYSVRENVNRLWDEAQSNGELS